MERQSTATVYLVEKERFLLIFHPKFQKWLPPGGHVEPHESPADAAKREVREETGWEISWFFDEHLWISTSDVKSFPRPIACAIENIPEWNETPSHQHIDFIYLATPLAKQQIPADSLLPSKWFSSEEIKELTDKNQAFPETFTFTQTALSLLTKNTIQQV